MVQLDLLFAPLLADALGFAYERLTTEGKVTISMLVIVSLFSWTVIIQKARQLYRASTASRRFYNAYRSTRDPLDMYKTEQEFPGAPAYEVYYTGAEELAYHLKNNPVQVQAVKRMNPAPLPEGAKEAQTDVFSRSITTKISTASFDSVRVALERAVSTQSLSLEKGMIILSTAVAGGPFIGLLGTVWGVMETFAGIGIKQAASLSAMAPGVSAALLATVAGLFVAIPAMFAYNYMITTIRGISQELDNFTAECATAIEHAYVDNRPVSEEIADALKRLQPARGPVPELVNS